MKIDTLKNKIVKTSKAYLKLGDVQEQQSSACYFAELLDYVGHLDNNYFSLGDKKYYLISYTEQLIIEKNGEIDQKEFDKALAEQLINTSMNAQNSDCFSLDFMPTDERRAFLYVLISKDPKISFKAV